MPSARLSLSNVTQMLSVLDLAPPTTKVSKINSTTMNIVAPDPETLMQFLDEFSKLEDVSFMIDEPFTTLRRKRQFESADLLAPNVTRSWFKPTELATIYNFPTPDLTKSVVVGVVSFGGGLYGSVSASGVVTGGDVQAYWSYLGISPSNMPRVIIKLIDGATNNPSDSATAENTLDVETIGAVFPSSNLTIILYIAPNSLAAFTSLFTQMLTVPVVVNGVSLTPNYISVSWGAPEIYFGNTLLNSINTVLGSAVSSGINVSVASGDNGSSDGVGSSTSKYCDFPSSSPNVIACGGTNLVSPNYVYDGSTVETASL